jgi:hypothetical protein
MSYKVGQVVCVALEPGNSLAPNWNFVSGRITEQVGAEYVVTVGNGQALRVGPSSLRNEVDSGPWYANVGDLMLVWQTLKSGLRGWRLGFFHDSEIGQVLIQWHRWTEGEEEVSWVDASAVTECPKDLLSSSSVE